MIGALTAERIIALLGLRPLPVEGGYFAETYRAQDVLPAEVVPNRYDGARSLGTAIYYLLTPDAFSAMHRLRTDELFHFYLGDSVAQLHLAADGGGRIVRLGADLARGMRPQVLVPRGVWQGARLVRGGRFALLGTTMAPGYDPSDFEDGDRAQLCARFPSYRTWIEALTRV